MSVYRTIGPLVSNFIFIVTIFSYHLLVCHIPMLTANSIDLEIISEILVIPRKTAFSSFLGSLIFQKRFSDAVSSC